MKEEEDVPYERTRQAMIQSTWFILWFVCGLNRRRKQRFKRTTQPLSPSFIAQSFLPLLRLSSIQFLLASFFPPSSNTLIQHFSHSFSLTLLHPSSILLRLFQNAFLSLSSSLWTGTSLTWDARRGENERINSLLSIHLSPSLFVWFYHSRDTAWHGQAIIAFLLPLEPPLP